MAKIKVEGVVDHLDREFRRALKKTIQKEIPEADFNDRKLFRRFKREIYRKCNIWERVPDRYVDVD